MLLNDFLQIFQEELILRSVFNSTDTGHVLSLTIPGEKKKDFNVSFLNSILTVKIRDFTKSYDLSRFNIKTDDIKASYDAGILNIYFSEDEHLKKDIPVD